MEKGVSQLSRSRHLSFKLKERVVISLLANNKQFDDTIKEKGRGGEGEGGGREIKVETNKGFIKEVNHSNKSSVRTILEVLVDLLAIPMAVAMQVKKRYKKKGGEEGRGEERGGEGGRTRGG